MPKNRQAVVTLYTIRYAMRIEDGAEDGQADTGSSFFAVIMITGTWLSSRIFVSTSFPPRITSL